MDSLNEKVWLLVEIISSDDTNSIIKGELFDKTKFKIQVPSWMVEPIEDKHPLKGWLTVDYHGEANGRISITLPAPILNMGHRISVSPSKINKLRIKL